jgi:hypothetical protein
MAGYRLKDRSFIPCMGRSTYFYHQAHICTAVHSASYHPGLLRLTSLTLIRPKTKYNHLSTSSVRMREALPPFHHTLLQCGASE